MILLPFSDNHFTWSLESGQEGGENESHGIMLRVQMRKHFDPDKGEQRRWCAAAGTGIISKRRI